MVNFVVKRAEDFFNRSKIYLNWIATSDFYAFMRPKIRIKHLQIYAMQSWYNPLPCHVEGNITWSIRPSNVDKNEFVSVLVKFKKKGFKTFLMFYENDENVLRKLCRQFWVNSEDTKKFSGKSWRNFMKLFRKILNDVFYRKITFWEHSPEMYGKFWEIKKKSYNTGKVMTEISPNLIKSNSKFYQDISKVFLIFLFSSVIFNECLQNSLKLSSNFMRKCLQYLKHFPKLSRKFCRFSLSHSHIFVRNFQLLIPSFFIFSL